MTTTLKTGKMNTNPFNLTGKLLVAVPGIDDYHFDQAVIYVYEHTEKGARGLVINKPCERIFLKEIFAHLKCKIPEKTLPPLLIGGPVQRTSGFILHSTEYTNPMSHSITSDIALAETVIPAVNR